MLRLISNGSHGNNVKIFVSEFDNTIRKVAFSSESHIYLINEYNGLKWYNLRLKNRIFNDPVLTSLNSFRILDLYMISDAIKISHLAPISTTFQYLQGVVDHYVEVWPHEQYAPIHGDLTLANVLFIENRPVIIDWEHFSNEKMPWGFDVLYFCLSALILPAHSRFLPIKLKEIDVALFKKLTSRFPKYGSTKEMLQSPLCFFREIFLSDCNWANIVNASPKKLFPLLIDAKTAEDLDKKICQR